MNIDPRRTALLLADFYALLDDLPHATGRNVLGNAQQLAAAARAAGMPVCYCATVFRPGYPEIHGANPMFAPKKTGGQPAVHDPAALIHPKLAPQPGDIVFGKHRISAFHATPFDMILRANGIDTLIIAGFATRGVVLSTVRQGGDMDYRLIVAEDCCAERDAATHDFIVKQLLTMQAEVAGSAALIAACTA